MQTFHLLRDGMLNLKWRAVTQKAIVLFKCMPLIVLQLCVCSVPISQAVTRQDRQT